MARRLFGRLLYVALCALAVSACQSSPSPRARQATQPRPVVRETATVAADTPVCVHCDKVIDEPYLIVERKSYHRPCYEQAGPRCGICRRALLGMTVLLGPGPGYHERCFKASARCDACSLPVNGERGGARELDDGRTHCGRCHDTAIFDESKARAVLAEARQELWRTLQIDVRSRALRLELVDRLRLARIAGSETANVKGFTEGIRPRIVRGRRIENGRWRLTIYAVFGLPREALLGVLVHELFHVWQILNGPERLDPIWREGAANYAQWRVLQRRGQSLWCLLLEQDPDPIYGDGFRRFQRWAERQPWRQCKRALARLRRFP